MPTPTENIRPGNAILLAGQWRTVTYAEYGAYYTRFCFADYPPIVAAVGHIYEVR